MLQSPPLMGVELGRVLCHFPMGLSCNHANNLRSLRASSVPHTQPLPMDNHSLLVPYSTMVGSYLADGSL